jgi:hypothetical protein
MDPSFCSAVTAQGPEDLISTAYYCPIYVLIECPEPWTGDFLNSSGLPIGQAKCLWGSLSGLESTSAFVASDGTAANSAGWLGLV